MAILFLSIFLAIMAVDIWAAILVVVGRSVRKWLSRSYFLVVVLAFIAAFLITSFFSYYSNSNTHIFGWPIPRVIFQRDTPTSPWLDYVGPTSWAQTGETLVNSGNGNVRSSAGVGLIWDSPFGPLRFDFAYPFLKEGYDRTQFFAFGGGTKF